MVRRLFSGEYNTSGNSMTAIILLLLLLIINIIIAINKKGDSLRRNKVLRQCHFRSTINGSFELGLRLYNVLPSSLKMFELPQLKNQLKLTVFS